MLRALKFLFILLVAVSCASPRTRGDYQEKDIAYLSGIQRASPKIVIDAGHGGKDLGAQSKTAKKVQEKNLNLITALILNKMLLKMGYETILTRGDDFSVPLDLRANLANSNGASLFVSIHYNAASNSRAEGVEVFYYNDEQNRQRTEASKKLAALVLGNITKNLDVKSRGVKRANLAVIRDTRMPAILVEGGFVTNDSELNKLTDPEFQKKISLSIAKAIYEFLKG